MKMNNSFIAKLAALLLTMFLTMANAQDVVITTAAELITFRNQVNSGSNFSGRTIRLANDIALTDVWTPIGNSTQSFSGTFDGQGYTISNLSVNGGDYAGLFGYVGANGQIKNLNVIAANIKTAIGGTTARYAGGLVGYYSSSKPIENCSAKADSIISTGGTGNTAGEGYGDGLVGYASGNGYGGGLVGYASGNGIAISTSYASSNVFGIGGNGVDNSNNTSGRGGIGGSGYGGGLVGYAFHTITIANSYASGNVSGIGGYGGDGGHYGNGGGGGSGYGGGLVGYANGYGTAISTSYASSNVSGIGNYGGDGGYEGRGGVGGSGNGGGLVGSIISLSTITNSYASGNVSGIGGDGGRDGGYYNYRDNDDGSGYGGGLVGDAYAVGISTSYASGSISGSTKGGIFGKSGGGTNTSVYYNSGGASKAAGQGSPTGISAVTSAVLKKKETYINWDFDEIWGIFEDVGYPYIKTVPIKATVSISDDVETEYLTGYAYTGSQIKPEPTVKLKANGKVLTKDADYVLSYGTNINIGKGTATIIGLDGDYLGLEKSISFDIIPKTLTLANATAQNKEYDGNVMVTITGGILEGVVAGEDVSFEVTGTVASGHVFNSHPVTANITLKGTDAGNYRLLTQFHGLTANITKKNLTLTGIATQDKVYDGNTTATITSGTLEGVVAGEGVSFDIKGIFSNKDAGNAKAVTASITLKGTNANSYVITQPTGLTANITKKTVTITLEPKSTTIDISDALPNFQNMLLYDGFIGGDGKGQFSGSVNVNHSYVKGTSPVGTYPITLSGLLSATNYTHSYDNTGLFLVVNSSAVPSSSSSSVTQSSSSVSSSSVSSSSSSSVTQSSSSISSSSMSSSSFANTVGSSSSAVVSSSSSSSSSIGSSSSVEPWFNFIVANGNGFAYISNEGNPINAGGYAELANVYLNIYNWDGWAQATVGLRVENSGVDLAQCINGFRYKYKGNAHRFSLESEYNNLQVTYYEDVSYSASAWNEVIAHPFTRDYDEAYLAGYSNISLNLSKVKDIYWTVRPYGLGYTSGYLQIKDFECLKGSSTVSSSSSKVLSSSSVIPSSSSNSGLYTCQFSTGCIQINSVPDCLQAGGSIVAACGNTPIRQPQIAKGPMFAYTSGNAIILGNLPTGTKVEVYGLNGKLITTSHSPLATSHLGVQTIDVHAKGLYIVKAGTKIFRVAVR
jgi:hypothetical protein